jgi:hypothetical protein
MKSEKNGGVDETAALDEEKVSLFKRIVLWKGVIRRFVLYLFNKNYIHKTSLKRQGKCLRCGACCKLTFAYCPYLSVDANGRYSCVKHESFRLPNCVVFPIDQHDLLDRNIISQKPCGYSFE